MNNTHLPARQQSVPGRPTVPSLALVSKAAPLGRLAPTTKAAVQALLSPGLAVRDQSEVAVQMLLVNALNMALFSLNHSSSFADDPGDQPGTAVQLLAGEVAKMVQRRFPSFKDAEVAEAIRRGSAGDWHRDPSKPLYLSVPTVQSWLSAYRDDVRLAAQQAVAEADQAFAAGGPTVLDLPAWHPLKCAQNLRGLLWLLGELNDGGGLSRTDKDVVVWSSLLFDWLDAIGVLGSYCPRGDRQALLDAEVQRLAGLPVTAVLDGRDRASEVTSFAKLLTDQSKSLASHPVMSEAKANCRRALLLDWLRTWTSARACEAYVVGAWASAYFSYYLTNSENVHYIATRASNQSSAVISKPSRR